MHSLLVLALLLACGDKAGIDTAGDDTAGGGDAAATDGGSPDGGSAGDGGGDGGSVGDGGTTGDGGDTGDGGTDGGSPDGGASDGGSTEPAWTVHCTRGSVPIGKGPPLQAWPDLGLSPAYRSDMPERTELNVTGETGTELVVDGRLLDIEGTPLPATTVHIYHAMQDGSFDTDSPDYQAMGAVTTDKEGAFCVHTLVPPHVDDGSGGTLPRKILMAVLDSKGVVRLSPHAHFQGDPALDTSPQPPQTIIPVDDMGDGNQRLSFDLVAPWATSDR